jgi:hypothetical protein
MTTAIAPTGTAQIRIAKRSPAYWRVTIDNPPLNVMGPEMVREFQDSSTHSRQMRMCGSSSSTVRSTAIS